MPSKKRKKKSKSIKRKIKVSVGSGFIDFIKINNGIHKIASHFRRGFLRSFPKDKDQHFFVHKYEYKTRNFLPNFSIYEDLFEYLDISERRLGELRTRFYTFANPYSNLTPKDFKLNNDPLLNLLKLTDKEVCRKLKLLNKIEGIRLEESMRCLRASCYFAAVVMAVSAAESRLHNLISQKNKRLYKQHFDKATLGAITQLFDPNHYKDKKFKSLKKLLPDKHRPLIQLLNNYRIFSAHPKSVIISCQTAKTILSLVFLLLLDQGLVVKTK